MGEKKELSTVNAADRVYKCAPLPFQGQKRYFATPFAEVLQDYVRNNKVELIVDLFGGSGLLAHTAKRVVPGCRVIYNDFDDYHVRLLNIQKTNRLLSDIRAIIGDLKRGDRLVPDLRSNVLQRIGQEAKTGYVDYITISSSLLFSGKYATTFEELSKESFYNVVKKSDYDVESGDYLAGLEIYRCDYMQLFEKYKDVQGVIFLVDPPYLSTDTSTYSSDKYWRLKDYLNVLNVLKGTKYIYFTSEKSSIVELCDWLENNLEMNNPFAGATLKVHVNKINQQAKYKDMMLYNLCG